MLNIPPKQFLDVFTARLAYLEAGEGPTIVCLHGALDCADTFAALFEANDFARLIAFDLPGSGESALPKDPFYGLTTAARYLADAIEQKDLPRVVLVAHEQGAAVAILLASLDPQRIKGLCILGAALSDQSSQRLLLRGSGAWPLRWMSRYTLSETMLRWRLNARMVPKVAPERPARLAKFLLEERRARLSLLQRITPDERAAIEPRLYSLETPVLFLQGEQDKLLSRDKAKQRQEQCQNARLEFIPGCAQYPHEEKPLEVALQLKTWLSTILPPDPPSAMPTAPQEATPTASAPPEPEVLDEADVFDEEEVLAEADALAELEPLTEVEALAEPNKNSAAPPARPAPPEEGE